MHFYSLRGSQWQRDSIVPLDSTLDDFESAFSSLLIISQMPTEAQTCDEQYVCVYVCERVRIWAQHSIEFVFLLFSNFPWKILFVIKFRLNSHIYCNKLCVWTIRIYISLDRYILFYCPWQKCGKNEGKIMIKIYFNKIKQNKKKS